MRKYRRSNKWILVKKSINNEDPIIQEKLKIVEAMAKELMEFHNVGHFNFKWNHSLKNSGQCSKDSIRLSVFHALNRSLEETKNTILHEIAHALVDHKHGHREVWQNKEREIGVIWSSRYRK